MKVTFNWLKQYTSFDGTVDQLADRLTMAGVEVERIDKVEGEFDGIVVAEVLSVEKHPNADRLSVCRVTDGTAERQIVCGATNFKVGDKVPLAQPGCTLPTPADEKPSTIQVGKIRGVESQGMMCSPKELALAEDAEGLLILPAEAKVGLSFADYLGRAGTDWVLDLEITPNRPDWNSVIGIARELSALTGSPFELPTVKDGQASGAPLHETTAELRRDQAEAEVVASSVAGMAEVVPDISELAAVRIEDSDLCPRYVARVILGVRIGPSPAWLRQALEKVGIRSINNVVDVTNFVMLESGQPLHAFDFRLITPDSAEPDSRSQQRTIVVRRADDQERFSTLDGQERVLTSEMLLIADDAKPLALAGVMGGQESEIHDQTRDVLLESAYFKPQNIRATSKRLDLRTDASYRFERGADVGICDWASRRAAQLIVEVAGGQLVAGAVDAWPNRPEPTEITLRCAKVGQLLGVEVPSAQQKESLERLGLQLLAETHGDPAADQPSSGPSLRFRIPTFRVDLKREVDLIEEVVRLFGVDRVIPSVPRNALGANRYDATHDELGEIRQILRGLGLSETQGQTLVASQAAELLEDPARLVRLANPLSNDMDVLRPSLVPGLLDCVRHNVNRRTTDLALVEIGRVFLRQPDQTTREGRRLALALTGLRHPPFWAGSDRGALVDIYDLKGLLEEFFQQFGISGVQYVRAASTPELLVEQAHLTLGKAALGWIGHVMPPLARQYDLRSDLYVGEIDLDLLLARRSAARAFSPLPSFPSVRRDLAMIVPEDLTHERIMSAVLKSKPAHLERLDLFDVFRGQNIPRGQKSMAYAFTYRHPERTLTDEEVNATHEKTVQAVAESLGVSIRQ